MRRLLLSLVLVLLLAACERQYEPNPDPNHTHADFAVWVEGEKVEFSDAKYMSGVSWDEGSHDEADEYHHEHLHLHDEVGHVLHRHKPGLTLDAFFESLDYSFGSQYTWRMFVTGDEMGFDLGYVFKDMDQVLLTTSAGSAEVLNQIEQLTDDACLYSRTCPWRGDPPAENCIADPAVPCTVPEDDL
tara:strand:+ start:23379 stop:23939 length:561 start_codon:yes stop_codon:yes gene_type:complete